MPSKSGLKPRSLEHNWHNISLQPRPSMSLLNVCPSVVIKMVIVLSERLEELGIVHTIKGLQDYHQADTCY